MTVPTDTPSRHAGGPVTGPNVLGRLVIAEARGLDESLIDLFANVVSANPDYLPGVAAGNVTLEAWYQRKAPQWAVTASTPTTGPRPIAHAAVRLNGMRPDGPLLTNPRLAWELGMLVVAPGVRGCGIASALIDVATSAFRNPLWSSVHRGGPGHRLLTSLGWSETEEFFWPADPVPGLVMVAPGKPAAA